MEKSRHEVDAKTLNNLQTLVHTLQRLSVIHFHEVCCIPLPYTRPPYSSEPAHAVGGATTAVAAAGVVAVVVVLLRRSLCGVAISSPGQ
jgi:hypothetical protein